MNSNFLLLLLSQLDEYVIYKISKDFPNIRIGEDIDLIVLDVQKCVNLVTHWHREQQNDLKILIGTKDEHTHIDFQLDSKLIIRLDLIESFSFFTRFSVKQNYIAKIFMNRVQAQYGDFYIWVPSKVDDITLRYFEFTEYFWLKPDKIKHYDYIENACNDDSTRKAFIENTHQFIKLRNIKWTKKHSLSQSTNALVIQTRKQAFSYIIQSFRFIIWATVIYPFKSK